MKLRELFTDWVSAFNQKVKLKGQKLTQAESTKAISNGKAASSLLKNPDLALHYNLHRFSLVEAIEDATTDEARLALCHRVAGIREFINHLEHSEWAGLTLEKPNSKESNSKEN